MDYGLLRELINKLEEYEALGNSDSSLSSFALWLSNQNHFGVPYKFGERESLESALGKELILVHRYARHHLRKTMQGGLVQNVEELGYLATLLEEGVHTKSSLIEANVHEKTTGMEIIKRLIRLGLIEQSDDPDDKRSKRLKITELGKTETLRLFHELAPTLEKIAGNLTFAEKQALLSILHKLNLYHRSLWSQK